MSYYEKNNNRKKYLSHPDARKDIHRFSICLKKKNWFFINKNYFFSRKYIIFCCVWKMFQILIKNFKSIFEILRIKRIQKLISFIPSSVYVFSWSTILATDHQFNFWIDSLRVWYSLYELVSIIYFIFTFDKHLK